MPGSKTPTPRAVALGTALREAREAAHLDQRTLGAKVGTGGAAISRYETGNRTPSTEMVSAILAVCGVNDGHRDEVIDLARKSDQGAWLAVSLPEQRAQLGALLKVEQDATKIVTVSPLMVPGLLQTAAYTRAVMTSAAVPDDEVETRVAIRVGRREVINQANPAELSAWLGEPALRQVIGGRTVMVEQLRHLLVMAQRANITVRVVPYSAGWYPALEGPFAVIYPEGADPVVHLENRKSGLFLHEAPDVASYVEATKQIEDVAMSADDTTALIAEVIHNLEEGDR